MKIDDSATLSFGDLIHDQSTSKDPEFVELPCKITLSDVHGIDRYNPDKKEALVDNAPKYRDATNQTEEVEEEFSIWNTDGIRVQSSTFFTPSFRSLPTPSDSEVSDTSFNVQRPVRRRSNDVVNASTEVEGISDNYSSTPRYYNQNSNNIAADDGDADAADDDGINEFEVDIKDIKDEVIFAEEDIKKEREEGESVNQTNHRNSLPNTRPDIEIPDSPPFLCPICNTDFASRFYLKQHMFSHSEYQVFNCKCGDVFNSKDDYLSHIQSCMKIRNVECRITASPARPKSYKCDLCGKYFKNERALKTHQASRYTCTKFKPSCKCGKSFRTMAILRFHEKKLCDLTRKAYKNFPCECEKLFLSKAALLRHKTACNSGKTIKDREFKCKCGKLFHSQKSYLLHKRRPCGKGPMNIVCICGMTYPSIVSMTSHKRFCKVLNQGLDQGSCQCGKEFKSPKALKIHMTMHCKNRQLEFKCTCGFVCTTENKLKIHRKFCIVVKHAKKIKEKNKTPVKCGACKKSFPTKRGLLTHKHHCKKGRNVHDLTSDDSDKEDERVKEFKCHCGRTFEKQVGLRVHENSCSEKKMIRVTSDSEEEGVEDLGSISSSDESPAKDCDICGKHFKNGRGYPAHVNACRKTKVDSSRINCRYCDTSFRKWRIERHEKVCTQREKDEDDDDDDDDDYDSKSDKVKSTKEFKCVCGRTSISHRGLRIHESKCDKKKKLDTSAKDSDSDKEDDTMDFEDNDDSDDEVKDKTFSVEKSVKEKVSVKSDAVNKTQPTVFCICGLKFLSHRSLAAHKLWCIKGTKSENKPSTSPKEETSKKPEPSESKPDVSTIFLCSRCNKKFYDKKLCSTHEAECKKDEVQVKNPTLFAHVCICKQKFETLRGLHIHKSRCKPAIDNETARAKESDQDSSDDEGSVPKSGRPTPDVSSKTERDSPDISRRVIFTAPRVTGVQKCPCGATFRYPTVLRAHQMKCQHSTKVVKKEPE